MLKKVKLPTIEAMDIYTKASIQFIDLQCIAVSI